MKLANLFLTCVAISILCFVNDVISQSARTIKIPLVRSTVQAAGTYGQPVINYYTPINVGTPAKAFNIQFDVGLSDSFLPHYNWNPFKGNLHYTKGFQCKDSSTCVKNDRSFIVEYQNCKLTGKPYQDIITFPNVYANMTTAPSGNGAQNVVSLRQNFLAVSDASDARFKDLPVDGYFGLSPVAQSPSTINNIIVNLHQSRYIDNLQFSMWLSPALDSPHGGELILGGVDPARYQGQIYWHHLSPMSNQWALGLQHVSVGSQVVSCDRQQCMAVLSSAVNEIYGPPEDVQKIYHLLNTVRQGNLQMVDCRRISQMPIITFTVDGIPYALLPSNYVRKTVSGTVFKSETCYVAILPFTNQHQKEWTLGTNFLGAYYSIFDMTYRQVGFASLR